MAAVTPIGLDIGAKSIRATETTRTKDGPVICHFGQLPLSDGAVQAGVIQDEKSVTAGLKELWPTARFHTKKVVLGVSNPQVVVREMSVANLPDAQLRQSLPFQVRDALPLPVEHSVLDFHKLAAPEDDKVRGLLIAVPKDVVLAAVHAVERAGLQVTGVDIASFALLRAASTLDSSVEAIVDIGAQATTVVVHRDGEPLMVRTIPRGGDEITEMLAAKLRLPATEAEVRKCEVGLDDEIDPSTAAVVRDAIRPLISEIRSSFTYVSSGEDQSRVSRLALTGGGALLPGLVEALHTQLGLDVLLADPTVRFQGGRRRKRASSMDGVAASAAVSIGLTLGAAS
jgi:type IV pilus assembly protein PilM